METNSESHLFVIGPQRSGTTWLYKMFLSQPEGVFLDRVEKENYFFAKGSSLSPKSQTAKFMNKLSGFGKPQLHVDVCSTYFGHPKAIKRILDCFPDAKFAYIYRDEKARKKSFMQHRNFNRFSTWILGYKVSWKLYEVQSKFDEFETWLEKNIPAERLCRLEFSDLKESNGQEWINSIETLTGFSLENREQGVVNKNRSGASVFKRIFFGGVRLLQFTRVHIPVKRLLLKNKNPNLVLATKAEP